MSFFLLHKPIRIPGLGTLLKLDSIDGWAVNFNKDGTVQAELTDDDGVHVRVLLRMHGSAGVYVSFDGSREATEAHARRAAEILNGRKDDTHDHED